MRFKHQDIEIEIGRTSRSRGEGCLWTDHIRETLAQAIRQQCPSQVQFDGQDVQARNNPRLGAKLSMRFLLDGQLLTIPHCSTWLRR